MVGRPPLCVRCGCHFAPMVFFLCLGLTAATVLGEAYGGKAYGQEQESLRPARSAPGAVIIASKDDYRIGISDVIEITIEKAPELSGNFRVSSRGTIPMPYLGPVAAEGRTPEELGTYIADRLRPRYLAEPHVTVAVKQYNSRSFFVQGSVKSPGVYYVDGNLTLFKLISIAGGLDKDHGATAYIIREVKASASDEKASGKEDGESEVTGRTGSSAVQENNVGTRSEQSEPTEKYDLIAVNIAGLMTGHFEKNVALEPGDLINIPQTDVFFVSGEVNGPGQFPLKPGTTLRQAIALAQGTKVSAAKSRGVIYRQNSATGTVEEVKVDIGAVMSGKREDVAIKPNDVIEVPNSAMKAAGVAVLRAFGLSFAQIRYY